MDSRSTLSRLTVTWILMEGTGHSYGAIPLLTTLISMMVQMPSLRKQLGRQFLIKSNINNWLVSHPGPGSLVFGGKVTSTVRSSNTWLAQVTSWSHQGFHRNQNNSYGPLLCMTKRYNSTNYYFDGRSENHRPTHDPLGGNSPNQKKNVANPHGNIFIRVE